MNNQLKLLVRITLIGIAALLLVWAFLPAYRTHVSGLALGMIVSLINAWLLLMKIEAVSNQPHSQERKRINIGTLSRMCMALIAVMIAVKMPQFDLVFTIIGLFFIQMATLLMGLLFIKK
ncbi:ATP synthase protein I [Paenibacillus sp. UNCCL117]|uniref:ATP synthase subunit I n=1 Tax=unclassified Paenibacillus TaxID=185978 RepID=UPI000880D230|nr:MULTISPECIES: ATP synthase subunit I [unclassified Paenibacillus]SDE33690.1 ATP synthase protein I [Paenibacillus sp. cl123]SFW64081.1 ATP synthase protein I [Paenibacillus sp. UNCCL117]